MANPNMKHSQNIPGPWYCTDPDDDDGEGCIACNVCYTGAPDFFAEDEVRNFQDALNSDTGKFTKFFQNMLKEGIYLPPSAFESLFISTSHSEEDLERTASAFRKALKD